jgi:hypothetical protein
MTAEQNKFQTTVESCENCGRETSQMVTVEIQTENRNAENAAFSREPYRIATCQTCGETTSQRMNNA